MKAIILAAGAGKRMNSGEAQLPKVLREVSGRALIEYPLSILSAFDKKDIIIVTGFMREKVSEKLGEEYSYAVQEQQNGTGHAVACALSSLDEGYSGPVLIINGDMPLLKKATIDGVISLYQREKASCVVLAADVKDGQMPYGRIIRAADGSFLKIVEDKDCNSSQKLITELNVGVYLIDADALRKYIGSLACSNSQGEYYLTDIPELISAGGGRALVYVTDDITEAYGVNTPDDLKTAEKLLLER